ncbi:MAG: ester cyclase [Anaerolineae bacterium]
MIKKITILFALLIAVIGLVPATAQDDMAQTNKQKVLDTYAAYNAGDREALYTLVTDPFMMDQGDPGLDETTVADLKGYDAALFTAMPDLQSTPDVVIAQGDWVVAQITSTGTFTQPFQFEPFGPNAFPATNAMVTWTELNFMHFNADGLVDEFRGASDPFILFGQLGIFPPMGGDESTAGTLIDSPAGYQALSTDELAATFTSGLEDRNLGLFNEQIALGPGTWVQYYADPYVLWSTAKAYSLTASDAQEQGAFFDMIKQAMPDATITVNVSVAQGDWVAAIGTVTGTFTEDVNFMGTTLTHTGEQIVWQASILDRYNADGKIVEERLEGNPISLLAGLGLMPPMGDQ